MSGTLNKLFEKGKAKVKEFQNQPHGGGAGGGYPGQQHQHHQQPQQYQQYQQYQQHQHYQQYSGAPYPPQQPYPPPNNPPYQQYQQQQQYPPPAPYQQQSPPPQSPHQQQQWGPPPNQWAPPSHQQPQWGQPPTQALSPPPVPQHSKPQSPQPPPIPPNHPVSHPPPPQPQPQPPPPQGAPPRTTSGVYWKPSFDPLTPVSQNFEHELGDHGWGNNEKQNYTNNPANSFHHNNHLIVRALVQNGTYTSARLSSRQTLARARGYLTATILAPCAEGIWPAFWVLPKEPFQWPNDGEVDIMESWNGDCVNHSCLHWGHYNGEDWNKHRVVETKLHDMPHQPHTFGFAWIEEDGIPDWRGRMIWYIDGRPIMKGNIPAGTKRMEEFRLLINVAMGGNVCGGKLPKDGYYDLVISDLTMCEEPVGGWGEFERTWGATPEGKTM